MSYSKLITLLFLVLFQNTLNSQYSELITQIKQEQSRIDGFDGLINNNIFDSASFENNALMNKIYFEKVNNIIKRIDTSSKLYNIQKKNLLFGLLMTLKEINIFNYKMPLFYQKLFKNAEGIIFSTENKDLESFLITDPIYAVKNLYFYKYDIKCKDFLLNATKICPNEVLKSFYKYEDLSFKDTIVEVCGVIAPNVTKNYLIGETNLKKILKVNTNSSIMGMRGFFNEYNILSKGMVLVDDIVEGNITIKEAHIISLDKRKFLRKMIELRNSSYVQATYSLDEELRISCLEIVREINNLHNETNPVIRFKSIDNFNWKELYTLLVYSEEEVFTSSFNGIFERLLYRLKEDKITGYQMLKSMNFNQFRNFLKLCAGYGRLNSFLNTMSKDKSNEILFLFTKDLEKDLGNLRSAIDVADAFGSIRDTNYLNLMNINVTNEYERVKRIENKNGIIIYSLLNNLFASKISKDSCWFEELSSKFALTRIDRLDVRDLLGHGKTHRQIHFFYDDEDGYSSFSSFESTFKNPNYKINYFKNYIKIVSTKGNKVEIYANLPKSEIDGHQDLMSIMDSVNKDIQMLVHRGHSYYALNTIDQIPSTAKIVFLGSCGSYNNINEVLNRSSNCHIISSKQIGTMKINNPLLLIISETVRNNRGIDWNDVWLELENKISSNKDAYIKFQDYVPPHKNLGALFLQTYFKLITE